MSSILAIVGAGGHGREAFAVARAVIGIDGRWDSVRIFDDNIDEVGRQRLARLGGEVAGTVDDMLAETLPHVVAVGAPAVRRAIAARIGAASTADRLIDPTATAGEDVDLAAGAMLYPGAICTTNIRIGHHSHLNCGAVVSHDCRIGDFVSLSPGVLINGNVIIEHDVFIGTGAVVLPGRRVGQGAVVGAGAVVVDDVAAGTTVVGNPARPVR